jgi:hypothetical protein
MAEQSHFQRSLRRAEAAGEASLRTALGLPLVQLVAGFGCEQWSCTGGRASPRQPEFS